MRNPRSLVVLVVALVSLASCTTERDGRAYRVFHNTTARYNGYFYVNEALKEADIKLEEMHSERWDCLLYTSPSPRD